VMGKTAVERSAASVVIKIHIGENRDAVVGAKKVTLVFQTYTGV